MADSLQPPLGMYRTAVAVADSTCARLFTYGVARDPAGPHERLTEVASLQPRMPPRDVDDATRDFVRSVGRLIDELIDEAGISRVVLCATPRMLGALEDVLRPRHDVVVEELAESFVELTTSELGAQLVANGRMPADA